MAAFAADPAALSQVLAMLTAALAPDSALQARAYAALAENARLPLFAEYLALVFVRGGAAAGSAFAAAAAPPTRLMAGLTLKRAVETGCLAALEPAPRARLRGELLEGLLLEDEQLRRAAANVLAAAVRREGLAAWPALPASLCGALDSDAPAAQRGALEALCMLAEDSAAAWCEEPEEAAEGGGAAAAGVAARARPVDALLPRLFRWMQAPSGRARRLAAGALFHLAKGGELGGAPVYAEYLRLLAALTSDPDVETRRVVLRSLRAVVTVAWEAALPNAGAIVAFVTASVASEDEAAAKEACSFWKHWLGSAIEADEEETQQRLREGKSDDEAWLGRHQGMLKPHLPALALALLGRMRLADADLEKIPASDLTDDAETADRDEDVRPVFRARSDGGGGSSGEKEGEAAAGRGGGGNGEDGEDGDGDEDGADDDNSDPYAEVTTFTVRQAAAEALDLLANSFNELVVEPLLPELQRLLRGGAADAALWKDRDLAMLAVGSLSEGGEAALERHLPMLIEFMMAFTRDPVPAVRSIAAWVLGRFARWIVDQDVNAEEDAAAAAGAPAGGYLGAIVPRLCEALLSPSRRMQRAACNAIFSFAHESNIYMARFAPLVLATARRALPGFQVRSRLALFDMLAACSSAGVFDEALGDARPENLGERIAVLEMLVPRVINSPRFRDPPQADVELPALLEALESVARPMGVGFAPACPALFERCVRLLETDVVLALAAADAGQPPPDVGLGELALCVVDSMFAAVGSAAADLLPNSGLVDLVVRCCVALPLEGYEKVRAAAFALLAELCMKAWEQQALQPFAAPIVRAVSETVAAFAHRGRRGQLRACNNAVWLLMKLAERLGPQLAEAVTPFSELFAVLLSSSFVNLALLENSAACVGALALHCGAERVVATSVSRFTTWAESWLHAAMRCTDADEKSIALRGFCAAATAAPVEVARFLPAVAGCLALACDSDPPPAGVPAAAAELLGRFKAANAAEWARLFDSFPAPTQERLGRLRVTR
jgi:transportin-1